MQIRVIQIPQCDESPEKEEQEAIKQAEEYFTRLDIPCQFKIVTIAPLQTIIDEIRTGDQDLIIVQGRFIRFCRKNSRNLGWSPRASFKPKCPIFVIHGSETATLPSASYMEPS